MDNIELASLRHTIDELDEQLIILLSQRFEVTERVGRLKARQRWQAVDPERESQQEHRYSALASQHGLSRALILKIFRTIIDEVVCNHRSFVRH
ncbi:MULTISPECIES: chorismate mutase [unclassified Pseudomonas]|uniref:chorismate mutase n=1 Tax=unclassified Pseudomonas TaxID=196821 RepID=UPI000BA338BB|nr:MULTISPECIES: chorismate mutase [unclassified Pseudomonas]MCU1722641.1 chorismate mutase [Pseudomonas sp. 5P_5.1_Bac1]MCU1733750.1 chorismate mutase [Pseudomonas sp. 20P_3.2_Bac4]MCU1742550.1 chorismate mutase [Pseudomonas sp. 20P_3.2_Bac5]